MVMVCDDYLDDSDRSQLLTSSSDNVASTHAPTSPTQRIGHSDTSCVYIINYLLYFIINLSAWRQENSWSCQKSADWSIKRIPRLALCLVLEGKNDRQFAFTTSKCVLSCWNMPFWFPFACVWWAPFYPHDRFHTHSLAMNQLSYPRMKRW